MSLGVLAIGGYQFEINDLQFSRSGVPAEALGLQDEYPGYTFSTQDNAGSFRNRGFEIEYRQQLTFLPGYLRGLGVFANYGNNKVSNPAYALGMARETASAGLQLRRGRLSGSIRGSWRGPTPIRTANLLEWRKPLWNLGVSAGFEFIEKTALFITGNNILNTPVIYYWTEGRGAGLDGLYTQWQQFSATWTVGVKTRF